MNKRLDIRKIPLEERKTTFKEVSLGLNEEEALYEANRCLQCKKAPCVEGCPAHINIPAFIKLIKEKKYIEAAEKIKESNNLPAICGRVCPKEKHCESKCVLNAKGEPVHIGYLERFAADYEAKAGVKPPKIKNKNGIKIAVIGSGPSGLSFAGDLAKLGYEVTIFEALHKAGGVLQYGIPEFRLPKNVVDREIEYVKSLGVKIYTNVVIGRSITINELLNEYGFERIYICTGAGTPILLNIPGENYCNIYSANEFLLRAILMKAHDFPEYDTPLKRGKKVVVIGGGNVAMDSARTALRMGAEEVTVIYRRTEKEMPARREEIENAKLEGVKFLFLASPIRFIADEKMSVKQVECIRMKLCEPDGSGRCGVIPIEDGGFIRVDADLVIFAIGQGPNRVLPSITKGIKTKRNGGVVVDEMLRTSLEKTYAGGDITGGRATVITAIADGKKAAKSVHKSFKN
ncbi:MAG: NADPH-dependent glutamate synthase [Candidatus Odinarchaeia archaeon]